MPVTVTILLVYSPPFSAANECVFGQTMSRYASIKPTWQINADSLYFVMSDLKTDTIPEASNSNCLSTEGTVMTLH